ncbi:MAG: DNA-directed RNA polymerase subunit beta' [Coriobacteriia bacterium]|nr:DNA-directed RNA polymerase subunit beta' [Coriobacteriia bacterium]
MPDVDVSSFDRLKITLASPEQMRAWSFGEVKKAETINYRTQKPDKDGLFCEKIFGPTKDWECACGKYRRVRFKGIKCENCGVEVTKANVRRERMGHIELASPVAHVWYAQGVAKHMSTLLDIKFRDLEKVLYFISPIVTSVDEERREEDYAMLRTELDEGLQEFVRERDYEAVNVKEARNNGIANAVASLDDVDICEILVKSGDSRTLKSVRKAVEKGGEGAIDKLNAFIATHGLSARYPEAAEILSKIRSGEIDLVEHTNEYGEFLDLEPRVRVEKIVKAAESDLQDIEEEYEERSEVRQRAFEEFTKLVVRQIFDDEIIYREMYRLYGPQVSDAGKVRDAGYFTGGMGAEHIRTLLANIDLQKMRSDLRARLSELHENRDGKAPKATVSKLVKQLSVVDAFAKSDIKPEWMVLDVIPVMPPELRPMVQLDGGRFATSDLNDLYRRVINRNNRLKKLFELGAPEIIINNEKRMLQEAVDKLFDNRRDDRRTVKGPSGRPLKSLSHTLNGKQGRFRQNLLGKRVDYSGRSVIVGGPELKLHQCGLPKYMALELFKPFVMKALVDRYNDTDGRDGAANIKAAKKIVDRQRAIVWDVLEKVTAEHPVLLNRAPTLHRLGIQAFEPILVEGKAIRLHPLVCAAFNADFDGDQMAVHVPLSTEAQAEARILMLSTNNIKSPSNGRPLAVPSQDMVLGLYYLTGELEGDQPRRVFFSPTEAVLAYDNKADLNLRAPIEVRSEKDMIVRNSPNENDRVSVEKGTRFPTTPGRILFNKALPEDFAFINYRLTKNTIAAIVEELANIYSTTDMGIYLDNLKNLGFHYATLAGVTVSLYDAKVPKNKGAIIEKYEKEADAIKGQYTMGLMTEQERHEKTIDVWNRATDEVGEEMVKEFDNSNPIFQMAESGARGNLKQIRQLAGMRGLMQSPKGDTIDRPIKTNFREGLTVLEYFISTHGARKGLADTALGTETGGYTTRRFLDFVHDEIVTNEDCGTTEGIPTSIRDFENKLDNNLIGRTVAKDITDKKGNLILGAGVYINDFEKLSELEAAGFKEVELRTALTCKGGRSICQKCYGWDLSTSRPVDIGTAVGVIAAQSIGEPGTQLTMRTFHTGGVAGSDITDGLPLVNEILESPRANREFAILTPQEGTVSFRTESEKRVIVVTNKKKHEWHSDPIGAEVHTVVNEGDKVKAGAALTRGRQYGPELLEIIGREKMLRWIIHELQGVYRGQGVELNDKHFEIIASRMLSKVKIADAGDTDFLVDSYVDRLFYLGVNEKTIAKGEKPADANETLIGPLQIVRASSRSLGTESFLSLASFMWTTTVLAQAAIEAREDNLVGLKENVIIGKLIPAGTGMKRYRNVDISYKGTTVSEADTSTDVAPDTIRGELKSIQSQIPSSGEWEPQFLDEWTQSSEGLEAEDVEKYISQTFDPNALIGGDGSVVKPAQAAGDFIVDEGDFDELKSLLERAEGVLGETDFLLGGTRQAVSVEELASNDRASEELEISSIGDLGIAKRWIDKFAEAGVTTIGDVLNKSESELLALSGIGAKAVAEVQAGLAEKGIGLKL